MDPLTKESFKIRLESLGFTVSRCGSCGLPLFKCWQKRVFNKVLEIRPTQTAHGTFVIKVNNTAVVSGYLYDLNKNLEKHFPTAKA